MIRINSKIHWLRRMALLAAFAVGLVSIVATGGSDDDDDPLPGVATVNGSVTGSGGIADVEVSAAGRSAMTDLNGYYELSGIPVPGDGMLVLTYEKEGYATFQRTIPVAPGESYSVAANLLPFHYSEQVSADVEQNLDVQDPNNPGGDALAQLSFPAGTLGSGDVRVNVAVGDPTTEEGRPTFPGDYMAATTQGGDIDTPLESVVFTEITVHDANGDEITEVSEPVTVTLRLPDSLQTSYVAGNTIEWWSYDEINGSWIREDADPATPETLDDALVIDQGGTLYAQAKVLHFTWWNVDRPMDQHACLCATVVDQDDVPLSGMQMIAEGVSYNGRSQPTNTDTDGVGCVTVKRSSDTVTELVRLFVESGSVQFPYDVTDAAEGDVATNDIFTPTVEGSTVYKSGECVTLNNNIALSYDGRVTGHVTFEGANVPVPGYVISTDFGASATTNSEGNYELNVPVGVPVTLFAVGQTAETVTVADAGTPEVVDFVIANRVPVIDNVSRAPEGSVGNNETVNLSVTAHDDDGDSLAYSWSTTQGSFNSTTTSSVIWTAPAAGAGTAILTVTVSDGKGGESDQEISIVYAGATSGDSLSFIFKDDYRREQPVEGVVVALYSTDNMTIAETLTSGVDGTVDFGDIGRNRASFTVAYESEDGYERFIDSFIEVEVFDDILYYTEEEGDSYYNPPVGTPVATVDYSLSDVPTTDAGWADIQPGDAGWSFSNNYGWLTNQPIYESYLQADGNLSPLATLNSASNSWLPIAYGFLLNQTVTDGASYDIALNRTPVVTGWNTQPATTLDWLEITAERSGVVYDLWASDYNNASALEDSGSILLPTEFPVDNYWVFAEVDGDASGSASDKRYNTLPQTLELPIPDYSFSNVIFDDVAGEFSWGVSGATPRDVVSIELSGYSPQEEMITWSVIMDSSVTTWQVMALPSPADTWLDTTTWQNLFDVYVEVVDFDFVVGLDEAWQFFLTGGSFEHTASQSFYGWADVQGLIGPRALAADKQVELKALAAEPEKASPADRQRAKTGGFSRLRRQ